MPRTGAILLPHQGKVDPFLLGGGMRFPLPFISCGGIRASCFADSSIACATLRALELKLFDWTPVCCKLLSLRLNARPCTTERGGGTNNSFLCEKKIQTYLLLSVCFLGVYYGCFFFNVLLRCTTDRVKVDLMCNGYLMG